MALVPHSSLGATCIGPQKALEDAIDGFHGVLTKDDRGRLLRLGRVRDAETVIIFTAQLDQENRLRKGRGVSGRLLSVLQSVQGFTTVVDTYVSSNPRIAALVWGSIKLALLVRMDHQDTRRTLLI
jgi:citrate lyase beta subunit